MAPPIMSTVATAIRTIKRLNWSLDEECDGVGIKNPLYFAAFRAVGAWREAAA
jgi:hypothetical protein